MLGVLALFALAASLCLLTHSQGRWVTRRSFARLALWGVAGLSLLPGCGSGGGTVPKPGESLLRRWARLGELWRELSSHRPPLSIIDPNLSSILFALRGDLVTALDALPAWPELRAVCEQRWQHIFDLVSPPPTCYLPPLQWPAQVAASAAADPVALVEARVTELERLVTEGTLTREVAEQSALVIARQAEVMLGRRDPQNRHTLPSPEAHLAGRRLVELTVDDLGWLAGPPRRDEGLRDSSPADKGHSQAVPE